MVLVSLNGRPSLHMDKDHLRSASVQQTNDYYVVYTLGFHVVSLAIGVRKDHNLWQYH